MNVERMLRGADVLDRFEEVKNQYDIDKFYIGTWHVKQSCGTTACAIGTMMMDSWFQKEGLLPEPEEITLITLPAVQPQEGLAYWPTFNDLKSIEAVQAFFDIDRVMVLDLFYANGYDNYYIDEITASMVANKMRLAVHKYLEGKGSEKFIAPENIKELV